MEDRSGAAVWRMTQHERSIAQCDLRWLPTLPENARWTLSDFEKDIRETLGGQLRDILSKERRVNANGVEIMTVVAAGMAEDVPVQWTLIHAAGPTDAAAPAVSSAETSTAGTSASSKTGSETAAWRRIQATFTMRAADVDAFAGSDVQLAQTLRLTPLDTPLLVGEAAIEEPASLPSGLPGDSETDAAGDRLGRSKGGTQSAEKAAKVGNRSDPSLQSKRRR